MTLDWLPSPRRKSESEGPPSLAPQEGLGARHSLLHEFRYGAALAIALVALLPGCTARFGFMEPTIVYVPASSPPPVVIRR